MSLANPTIAAIILAAGRSTRMQEGQHKLLLPLGTQPVLAHVVNTILNSQARPIFVVIGYRPEEVRPVLRPFTPLLTISENVRYEQGMSSSLHTGVEALMAAHLDSTIDGALIVLGDQPLLTSTAINRLIATRHQTGKSIIAPLYHGKRGSPVLFAASLFPELLTVTGDQGAKSVIEQHRHELATVEIGDDADDTDVDTWEAYQQVLSRWEQRGQES